MIWSRKHEHDRQPAAVQHSNVSLFSTGLATTLILRRCACGDVDSLTLIGKWTLAQVRGEAEPAPEIAEEPGQ